MSDKIKITFSGGPHDGEKVEVDSEDCEIFVQKGITGPGKNREIERKTPSIAKYRKVIGSRLIRYEFVELISPDQYKNQSPPPTGLSAPKS